MDNTKCYFISKSVLKGAQIMTFRILKDIFYTWNRKTM